MVLCISSQSYREPLFGQIACASHAIVKAIQRRCIEKKKKKKERLMVKKREELEGSIRVHIPEVLLEGPGTLTVSPPGSATVKGPDCERRRPKPVRAAPLPDTSLASAACGFGKSPRFVGHRELHLGTSITLEAQTWDAMTNCTQTISTSQRTNWSSGVTDSPYPSTRPSLNSPSNLMPSYRLKTPVP